MMPSDATDLSCFFHNCPSTNHSITADSEDMKALIRATLLLLRVHALSIKQACSRVLAWPVPTALSQTTIPLKPGTITSLLAHCRR